MSRPRFIGLALFGLATLLLAIGVGSVCRGATRLTERGDATAAVEAAARRFVLASGTYDATRNAERVKIGPAMVSIKSNPDERTTTLSWGRPDS